jgi:DNA mismatch repair protein MutL
MSDVIRLLPDSVANQIAAGEVIQRPASVIKELVENAVDAGAMHIQVNVTDAGKTSIQVIDDGKGMSETDARLSFERHATSKIREAADLFALRTMGFRGEALASIAAVAQVELTTRQDGEELGTRLVIAGSKVESQEAVACARGSIFTVKNLFFNVPARRKFLKSNQTELSNICAEFERMVLVNPEVSFILRHNDVELFNLPAYPLRQRIMGVFGKKINHDLLSFDVNTSMVHVSGFVGNPDSARKKGSRQFFFVNGRYMRHPYFHRAVMEAYEHLVPQGEQVSYFIYFDVDPANIDVNIHPTKTEIKFENEQSIWQILAAAIKETLGKFNAVPSIDFDTEGRPDIPAFDSSAYTGAEPPQTPYNPTYNPFLTEASKEEEHAERTHAGTYSSTDALFGGRTFASKVNRTASSPSQGGNTASAYGTAIPSKVNNRTKDWQTLYAGMDTPVSPTSPVAPASPVAPPQPVAPPEPNYREPSYEPSFDLSRPSTPAPSRENEWSADSDYITEDALLGTAVATHASGTPSAPQGPAPSAPSRLMDTAEAIEKAPHHYQYKGRYILTSIKSGLMIIDQHRAHVRVLYERYLHQIEQQRGVSQQVLFPDIVQFPMSEVPILQEIQSDLAHLGFDLTDLGGGSYAIQGVPSGIDGLNPVELVQRMVHTTLEKGSSAKSEVQSELALTLARAAAIVAGQVLSNQEMSNLVDELLSLSTPNYTPDGKTVLTVLPEGDIEKMFR